MYQRHRHHHHHQRHRPSWWIIDHHSSKSTTGPGAYLSPLWSYQGRRDVHDAPRLSRQKRKERSRHHRSSKSFTDLVNPLKKAGVTTRMIPRNYLTSKRAVVSDRSHNQQLLWCFCPNLTEVLDCVVQIIPALDRTLIGSTLTDQNADEYCNERVSRKKIVFCTHQPGLSKYARAKLDIRRPPSGVSKMLFSLRTSGLVIIKHVGSSCIDHNPKDSQSIRFQMRLLILHQLFARGTSAISSGFLFGYPVNTWIIPCDHVYDVWCTGLLNIFNVQEGGPRESPSPDEGRDYVRRAVEHQQS